MPLPLAVTQKGKQSTKYIMLDEQDALCVITTLQGTDIVKCVTECPLVTSSPIMDFLMLENIKFCYLTYRYYDKIYSGLQKYIPLLTSSCVFGFPMTTN